MPYYKVYFRYVVGEKVKRGHSTLDASNKEDAKMRVIRGEKKHFGRTVVVDRVIKQ